MLVKTISSLLFMSMPIICFGFKDSCTNPKDYTIDKRCYVNDETWAKTPYKYILKMYDSEKKSVICTANMVSGKIVTAHHCTEGNIEDKRISNLKFIAFDGTVITAEKVDLIGDDGTFSYEMNEDWAIFTPKPEFKFFVDNNSIYNIKESSTTSEQNYVIIGYGGLKILSDEEISKFIKAYKEFLKDNEKYINDGRFGGHDTDDTVDITNARTIDGFYKTLDPYLEKNHLNTTENIFFDKNNLKLSVCHGGMRYHSSVPNLASVDCQVWHGNSGSGIYGVPKTDKKTDISCKNQECAFLGGYVASRSLISLSPKEHTAQHAIFYTPSDQFKSYLDSE